MTTHNSLWKNSTLLTLAFSESVSNLGTWVTMMAVYAMIVFRGNGTILQSSGVYLAGLLPTLLFSPAAGWLCDHIDRRMLMIGSELLSGLVISGLIFARPLWLIYTLLAVQSISTSLMSPARQAVLPDVMPRTELTRANAFLQQLAAIIKIAGPILAGAVLAVLDPHQAIILDVVSFALSAVILSRLPYLPAHARQGGVSGAEERPSEGVWQTLRSQSGLQALFLTLFLSILVIVGFDILAPIYIRDELHGSESLFGIIIGLIGAGTLACGAVLMLRKSKAEPWRDLLMGIILLAIIPLSLVIAAFIPVHGIALAVVIVGILLGGAGNGLVMIQSSTLLQLLSPAHLLGRLGGFLQSVSVAGQLIGVVFTPIFIPRVVTIDQYLGVAAAALILVAIILGRSILRFNLSAAVSV